MKLIDSTLREGEQMSGIYFTLSQKLEIVKRLAAIGIEEIELGIATMSNEMPALIMQARSVAPRARLALWCRGLLPDIRDSAELAPDVLSISLPVSDLHIQQRLGKDRHWIIQQIPLLVTAARQSGIPFVSLGLEDTTRADPAFFLEVLRQAEFAGADRVRLADTLGQASPLRFARLVRAVQRRVSLQVGVHTHNDFGMATANVIAAGAAGADWADVTILGLGERAGTARLEEVIGYYALRKGSRHYDTTCLYGTCRVVARMAGITVSPYHPIIGKNIFACETGLHLDGLAKDPATYEPFPPERVQAIRKVALGKKVGRNAVITRLHALGLDITREDAVHVTQRIRTAAQQLGRPLTNGEVERLVKS